MKSWQVLIDRVGRRYVYAVGSSLVSKIATVLTQLAIMPLAASALGLEVFAVYVVLLSATGWLSLANPGIAPMLSIEIARNSVSGAEGSEQTLLSSAFFLSGAIATVVAVLALAAIYVFPVDRLFGNGYFSFRGVIQSCLLVVVVAFVAQSVLVIFEAAHIGRQRQHLVNVVMAVSAIPTLLAVVAVAKLSDSLLLILAATLVPPLIVRLIFAVSSTHIYATLTPRLRCARLSVARGLASTGGVYSLAGTFGNFLAHVLPITLVSLAYDAESTAAFGTVMNLIILISGVTAMIVGPAVPSLATAWVERRKDTVKKAYLLLLGAGMGFSLLVAALLIFFGPLIMQLWMRGQVNVDPALMFWAGVYFVFATWEVIHFTVLSALRQIKAASLLVFCRALLGALFMALYLPTGSSATPFVIMTACVMCVNAIPLFLILRTTFGRLHALA